MSRNPLSALLDVDLPVFSETDLCQVCLAATPVWLIPTTEDTAVDRLADRAGLEADETAKRYVVCTDCLSLIEDGDVDAVTKVTVEAILGAQRQGLAKVPKVARKQFRMRTHLQVRQVTAQILASVCGDPVRLS